MSCLFFETYVHGFIGPYYWPLWWTIVVWYGPCNQETQLIFALSIPFVGHLILYLSRISKSLPDSGTSDTQLCCSTPSNTEPYSLLWVISTITILVLVRKYLSNRA